jgi:hypothetical protein
MGVAAAWQLAISTEIGFTMTLALALCLAVISAVIPGVRGRVRDLLSALAYAYLLAALLATPLLAYVLKSHQPVGSRLALYAGDLLNIVSPTKLTWLNSAWSERMASHFRSGNLESGLYLGLPLLLIVVWFAWSQRRKRGSLFLTIALALALFCALGTELDIGGTRILWLPWNAIRHLPLFKSVLPVRFSLYSALTAAVIAALWSASPLVPKAVRAILLSAAILALVPNVTLKRSWYEHPTQPSFFTSGTYRRCFAERDNVLVLPIPSRSDAMLWQAESTYSFSMADGYITAVPPTNIPDRKSMLRFFRTGKVEALKNVWQLVNWAHARGVTLILLDKGHEKPWKQFLAPVARPQEIGGVYLYRLMPKGARPCVDAGSSVGSAVGASPSSQSRG